MRTRNPNTGRATAATLGFTGTRRSGSHGIRVIDAVGTEVFPVTDLHVPWVLDLADEQAQIGAEGANSYTNDSGAALVAGDVVIIVGSTVTTTTTAQYSGPVGVVLNAADDGDPVSVQTVGYCPLVNVTASVTAGNYLETSTTAGDATESASRRTGSFGVILTSGTAPTALLFGVPDTGSGTVDFLLKYAGGQDTINAHGSMGTAETIDPADGNVHSGTLDADCTVTLTAPAGSGAATIELWITQDGTGGWDITWPGSVTTDGSTPDTTAGATVRYILETINGGTTWLLNLVGGSTSLDTPALTFGTTNSTGVASSAIGTDATIAIFDTTAPVTQAFSDTAAVGTAAYAARRDHVHGMPAGVGEILITESPSTPLVFADLIQNEAQDDLVYADL